MNILQGAFVVIGLGTPTIKYYFNGQELQGVVKMFVYKGTSVTLTVTDKNVIPLSLMTTGIKVKEVR